MSQSFTFTPQLHTDIIDADFVNVSKDRSLIESYLKHTIDDSISIVDTKKTKDLETNYASFKFVLSKHSLIKYDEIKKSIEEKFGIARFKCEKSIEYIPCDTNKNSTIRSNQETVIVIRKCFLNLPTYYRLRILVAVFFFFLSIYIIYIIVQMVMYKQ